MVGFIRISFLTAERGITIKTTDHAHTMHLHLPNWPAQLIVAAAFLLMIGVAPNWFAWANWRWLTTLDALTYPLYPLPRARVRRLDDDPRTRQTRPGRQPGATEAALGGSSSRVASWAPSDVQVAPRMALFQEMA